MGLIPGAADLAGQVQGLPVTRLGPVRVAAGPVQRPHLVERLNLTPPVAEVAVDAQRRLQRPGRARIVPGQPPYGPQVGEGLASPSRSPRSRQMPSAASRAPAAPG